MVPNPSTPENEFKQSFFERVRYANENYGVLEPGWRSDRGRLYIKYGPLTLGTVLFSHMPGRPKVGDSDLAV